MRVFLFYPIARKAELGEAGLQEMCLRTLPAAEGNPRCNVGGREEATTSRGLRAGVSSDRNIDTCDASLYCQKVAYW